MHTELAEVQLPHPSLRPSDCPAWQRTLAAAATFAAATAAAVLPSGVVVGHGLEQQAVVSEEQQTLSVGVQPAGVAQICRKPSRSQHVVDGWQRPAVVCLPGCDTPSWLVQHDVAVRQGSSC
jgi:hypothetical protein